VSHLKSTYTAVAVYIKFIQT